MGLRGGRRNRQLLIAAGLCLAVRAGFALAQEAPQPSPEAGASAAAATAPRVPTEAYAYLPALSNLVLSPDGRRFAALLNEADHTVLIGLTLDAWLTRPVGSGSAPLPLVLLPHGRPASRDGDDFDSWSELLANRCHAVLQVNFRGSVGYGRQFLEAGLQSWVLEMRDDLTDAVQWAIAERIADRRGCASSAPAMAAMRR